MEAALPLNEERRLKDLYSYGILDTGIDTDFEDLVELVSQISECPIASITFIDRERQWFKAERNMSAKEGARNTSFCAHTILQNEVLLVNDAAKDPRFHANPLVTHGLQIRFYAGAPIISAAGFALGSVCAIDKKPRELSVAQRNGLTRIARQAARLLELHLNNRKLEEVSDSLLTAERQLAQLNLVHREQENYQTAYALHEEIAQATAGVKFYLDLARRNQCPDANCLDKAITELNNTTRLITQLSRSIIPTTYQGSTYEGHIRSLVENWRSENIGRIHYRITGKTEKLQGEFGLMLYRVVEDLFRLAGNTQSLRLHIRINTQVHISFEYQDDPAVPAIQKKLLAGNIANRVDILSGSFASSLDYSSLSNSFQIRIPLYREVGKIAV